MRSLLLMAAATLALASPARADDASDIAALEAEWARAFRSSDFDSLDRLVAPEFTLVRIEEGVAEFTPRDR